MKLTLQKKNMNKLNLPKYLRMPDNTLPVTGCKEGEISEYVILTNFRKHIELAKSKFNHINTFRKDQGWEVDTITGKIDNLFLTVCCSGIGSGQTSNVMEELILLGGKYFIQLGATGALQPHIDLGDIIIPTGSVRDEGTTKYYAPLQYPAVSDFKISNMLFNTVKQHNKKVYTGIVRTTDGFYPSQRIEEYVNEYSNLGVLSVEQEISTILTIASTKNCYASATLLVIGNLINGLHSFNGDQINLLEKDWFDQFKYALQVFKELSNEN